jgi:hypothetical protein
MELLINRINRMIILNWIIIEYIVIIGLDTKWQEIGNSGGL